MIEFSLSKLNMLIFVTAVAAIVIFFMAAVNSNMKTRQSFELVYKVGKELKTGIESNSYCTIKFIDIPKTIQTNSNGSDAFSIKYKLNISSYDPENSDSNKLVLAVIDRKQFKPKIYAAYYVDYKGAVNLYESNCSEIDCSIEKVTDETVDYDPSKAYSIDTHLLFAKTIDNGNPTIYLVPCVMKNKIYSCREFLNLEASGPLKEIIPCLSAVNYLVDYSDQLPGAP